MNSTLARPDGLRQLEETLQEQSERAKREAAAAIAVLPLVDRWSALTPGRRHRPTSATVANRRGRMRRLATMLPTLGLWTRDNLQRVVSPGPTATDGMVGVGNGATQRTYLRDLRQFCQWLTEEGLLPNNPATALTVDRHSAPPIRAVPIDLLLRIHDALPMGPLADAFGFLVATGAEPQIVERVTVEDVREATQQVWLAGTKNSFRQRWAYVEAWYWPTLVARSRGLPSGTRLFAVTRGRLAAAVRAAVQSLRKNDPLGTIPADFRPYDTRHAFAARYVASGASLRVLADQLGHANESMIIRLYGRYRSDSSSLAALDPGSVRRR
ncbi:MAG: tyrosine-type recombinase/integrase [Gemmatimonadaceae bacterium]|nr:tyrosine-type recombinase/integrase [Gemmatimonadaceae bacterium]